MVPQPRCLHSLSITNLHLFRRIALERAGGCWVQGLAERTHPRGKQGAPGVEVGMWRPSRGCHVWLGARGRGLENSLIFSIFAGIAFPASCPFRVSPAHKDPTNRRLSSLHLPPPLPFLIQTRLSLAALIKARGQCLPRVLGVRQDGWRVEGKSTSRHEASRF